MDIKSMEKLLKSESKKRNMKLSKNFIHLGAEAILTKKNYSDDRADYFINDFLEFIEKK